MAISIAVTIREVVDCGTDLFWMDVEGEIPAFVSGQFFRIKMLLTDGSILFRPFSAASSYFDGCKNLVFLIKEVGKGTKYLHSLGAGSVLSIEGPFGDFKLPVDNLPKKIAMIAGGTGIAPMLSAVNFLDVEYKMIAPAKDSVFVKNFPEVFLVHSVSNPDVYKEVILGLQEVAKTSPWFGYLPVFTRSAVAPSWFEGNCVLGRRMDKESFRGMSDYGLFMLCGSPDFTSGVQGALAEVIYDLESKLILESY
jgi:ferredoxin--NADP+ reductase